MRPKANLAIFWIAVGLALVLTGCEATPDKIVETAKEDSEVQKKKLASMPVEHLNH